MGNLVSSSLSCHLCSDCQDATVGKATYMHHLKENLDALRTELERLIEVKNDVMRRVEMAAMEQMIPVDPVVGWLSMVEAVEVEVVELIRNSSQEIDKLCLGGFCSMNCYSSYKIGEKVAKTLQRVAVLKGEGEFEVVASRIPVAPVDEIPIQSTVGLESIFDSVVRFIDDEQVGIIGLYGMGGVGKTTLLTQINNKFLDMPNDFDLVIWVNVSRELQLEKIQDKIGKKIGLLGEWCRTKNMEEKAVDIFRILMTKKFVLLIDDLWERLDLVKLGVPVFGYRTRSKMLFTTRSFDVCINMEAHEIIKVECLTDEYSWTLFKARVGDSTLESHPEIPELAKVVVKECGGLPLAIITVARAMACKKTPEEWKHAIQVLRRSNLSFPGMEDQIYIPLKFSYDSLPKEMFKFCLLFCGLFPSDFRICVRDLIDYWISEGLLDDRIGAENQGYYIIGVLIRSSLLEEDEDEDGYVKMHNVVHDMILWIASGIENEKNVVYTDCELTELPDLEKLGNVRRMSVMQNQIKVVTEIPTCPHLQTLFLNCNPLRMISSDFFQYVPCLKVLNLSDNPSLTQLPSGISELVSLQHLDLSRTSIKELPNELRALVKLKCLNLELTSHLRSIPRQLISNFSALHVLRLWECDFLSRATDDSAVFDDAEVLTEELLCLENLEMLSISLNSFHALQRLLTSRKLQSSTQSLGLRSINHQNLRKFSLADVRKLNMLSISHCKYLEEMKVDCAGKVMNIRESNSFHSLQAVTIHSCFKLRDLTWLINAPNLKRVAISNCFSMEEIISPANLSEFSEVMGNLIPFAKLKFLELEDLSNLQSIYWNTLPSPCLKEVKVIGCPKLKKLPFEPNSFVINGEQQWWEELEWEDEATLLRFIPCFKSVDDFP